MSVSPPRPKGPPLNALRAFEAAARLGGFTPAALELCVTPGAVSQHIKFLEEWTGAALFERRSQGVTLTPHGAAIAKQFSEAFDVMGDAVRALRAHHVQPMINIAALPSIAQLWLSPRLPAIRSRFPDQKLSVTAMESAPNLRREIFDISVFLDQPKGHNDEYVLSEDMIFPVCSPEIAKRLKSPRDLLGEVWLYDSKWPDDWAIWMQSAAPKLSHKQEGPQYSLYNIALEEAKNGAGVLIGHQVLVQSMLKNGDIVAPFKKRVPSGKSLILEVAKSEPINGTLQEIAAILRE